ncbi:DUF2798 domain-containing protein [Fulvivirgaceae bacterium BMA10]|uniref:DUF2798 domain-containing protein n=1 Tax=Splendidivirga corallicola TaxID=3051826 RepID=A0ABT8KNI0_9BACT|nr:DUF2798 domain-containing protein [Fulvivirgaceae bacterium BMA10]
MKIDNKKEIKSKIVFALVMGSITTGIISFSLIALNIGFNDGFLGLWLRSWVLAYLFVIPAILFIAPPVEKLVNLIFKR